MRAAFASAVIGLWLMASPAVLGYSETMAGTGDRVVGPIVVGLGIAASGSASRVLLLGVVPLGLWLVVGAPLALSGPTGASASGAVSGLLLTCLGLCVLASRAGRGVAWRALFRAGGCGPPEPAPAEPFG